MQCWTRKCSEYRVTCNLAVQDACVTVLIDAGLDAETSQFGVACNLAVQDVFATILAALRAQNGRTAASALEAPLYGAFRSATDKDPQQQLWDLCGPITGPAGQWRHHFRLHWLPQSEPPTLCLSRWEQASVEYRGTRVRVRVLGF